MRTGKKNESYETMLNQKEEKLIKGSRSILGIDIGSSSIKIVQMKKGKIIKWVNENLPEGMVNQGRIEASVELAEVVKKMLQKNKINEKQCSLCISGSEMVIRELKLPEMSENQILDNIKHEITSFLPLNHDEYCIDYKVLEYTPGMNNIPGKMRIMVAAVPNSLVQSYINTLKKANLKVAYVDVIPNVIEKLTKWTSLTNVTKQKDKNIGFIDFGAHTTNIVLLKDGNYFIYKTIATGGDYLTSQISEKMNLDYFDAEAFKKKNNFFESDFHNMECLFVKNTIDFLISDIERTLEFYRNRNNQNGIERLYLIGGGSMLKGLSGYIKERINVEVSFLSEVLQQLQKSNDFAEKVAVFPQAIGATLREE